jgi:hypothetical protein
VAATKLVELQKICYKETRGQVFGQHFLQKKRSCIDMKIMLSCAHYLQLLVSSARHTVISINRLHIMSNEVRVVYATPFVLKVGACFRSRRARLSELKKQTWALRHAGRNHVTEIISRGLQRLQKPAVALQRFLQLLQPSTKISVGIQYIKSRITSGGNKDHHIWRDPREDPSHVTEFQRGFCYCGCKTGVTRTFL